MKSNLLTAVIIVACLSLSQGSRAGEPAPTSEIHGGPALIWKFPTSAPIVSSPVIGDGLVLFGGHDSLFYAVELSSGALSWKLPTGGQIRSTPAVDTGVVYFLSGDGLLRAARFGSGELIWTFATGGDREHDFADYYQSSPVISDGILYFGSGDGHVYAVRASDGSLVWKFLTGDVVHATPAVDSNRVFVGSFDGYFYALDRTTGALVWKFKSVGQTYFPKGEFSGSPVVRDAMVFVGARDYNFYTLDRDEGFCHWNKAFPRGWALPCLVSDTTLYVGTSDDRLLLALDPATGREYWRTNLGFNIFGGLAIADTVGYVGTLLGKLYGIDLRTGAIAWTFATDGYERNHLKYFKPDDSFRDDIFEIVTSNEAFVDVEHEIGAFFSTPALSDEYLVVTSTDGNVYCFMR